MIAANSSSVLDTSLISIGLTLYELLSPKCIRCKRRTLEETAHMKNRSDAISVRVSREAKAELQRIADAERRTLSQLVSIIIDDYLKAQAQKK